MLKVPSKSLFIEHLEDATPSQEDMEVGSLNSLHCLSLIMLQLMLRQLTTLESALPCTSRDPGNVSLVLRQLLCSGVSLSLDPLRDISALPV